MAEEKKHKEIELRSEKVRNIVGKVPPYFLRIGISVISLIVISVLLLGYFIPYPQYKIIPVNFYSYPLVQTDKAIYSGTFFSMTNNAYVSIRESIGWIQGESDSIKYYKSNVSGRIFFNLDNGDFVEKNNILYTIIPNSIQNLYAVSYINAKDIAKIKIGQTVSISFKDKFLKGNIAKIFPFPDKEKTENQEFYKLKIHFPKNGIDINKEILLSNKKHTGQILVSNTPILYDILNKVVVK